MGTVLHLHCLLQLRKIKISRRNDKAHAYLPKRVGLPEHFAELEGIEHRRKRKKN